MPRQSARIPATVPFLGLAMVALLLAAPGLARAGGDSGMAGAAAPPPVASGPPTPIQEPDLRCDGSVVAQVVTLSGSVRAQAAGAAPRSLACDDPIRACDTLVTGSGAHVGLLVAGVLAQLDGDSRVSLGAGSSPRLFVHSGGVRLVDPRPATAEPWQVGTPQGPIHGTAGDAEVRVGQEHTASSSSVCLRRGAGHIAASGAAGGVAAGQCAQLEGGELRRAALRAGSIELASALSCPVELAGAAGRFSPGDVAAPPFGLGAFPAVPAADTFRREPCDVPGSICGKGLSGTGGFTDPNPATGPGGPGFGGFTDPNPDTGPGGPGFGGPPSPPGPPQF